MLGRSSECRRMHNNTEPNAGRDFEWDTLRRKIKKESEITKVRRGAVVVSFVPRESGSRGGYPRDCGDVGLKV